jgi:hypothetical protein
VVVVIVVVVVVVAAAAAVQTAVVVTTQGHPYTFETAVFAVLLTHCQALNYI